MSKARGSVHASCVHPPSMTASRHSPRPPPPCLPVDRNGAAIKHSPAAERACHAAVCASCAPGFCPARRSPSGPGGLSPSWPGPRCAHPRAHAPGTQRPVPPCRYASTLPSLEARPPASVRRAAPSSAAHVQAPLGRGRGLLTRPDSLVASRRPFGRPGSGQLWSLVEVGAPPLECRRLSAATSAGGGSRASASIPEPEPFLDFLRQASGAVACSGGLFRPSPGAPPRLPPTAWCGACDIRTNACDATSTASVALRPRSAISAEVSPAASPSDRRTRLPLPLSTGGLDEDRRLPRPASARLLLEVQLPVEGVPTAARLAPAEPRLPGPPYKVGLLAGVPIDPSALARDVGPWLLPRA